MKQNETERNTVQENEGNSQDSPEKTQGEQIGLLISGKEDVADEVKDAVSKMLCEKLEAGGTLPIDVSEEDLTKISSGGFRIDKYKLMKFLNQKGITDSVLTFIAPARRKRSYCTNRPRKVISASACGTLLKKLMKFTLSKIGETGENWSLARRYLAFSVVIAALLESQLIHRLKLQAFLKCREKDVVKRSRSVFLRYEQDSDDDLSKDFEAGNYQTPGYLYPMGSITWVLFIGLMNWNRWIVRAKKKQENDKAKQNKNRGKTSPPRNRGHVFPITFADLHGEEFQSYLNDMVTFSELQLKTGHLKGIAELVQFEMTHEGVPFMNAVCNGFISTTSCTDTRKMKPLNSKASRRLSDKLSNLWTKN